MAQKSPIKLAIVGNGGMGHAQARAFKTIPDCTLVAACDIFPGRAREFADEFDIPHAYLNLDDLLANEDVDAISVVTPDACHDELSLQGLASGKHVLCEKPLTTSYADAQRMADAAKGSGLINMVDLSYRRSSAVQKAHELVEAGALGRILHVEASYLQSWITSKVWGDWRTSPGFLWRCSSQNGGTGALGDIGVHIIDFATFVAGDLESIHCQLMTLPKDKEEHISEYVLDANDSAVLSVKFAGGALGTIHLSHLATGHANSLLLRVYGEKGSLIIDLDHSYSSLKICQGKNVDKVHWKTLRCDEAPTIFERFIHSIQTGKNDQPDFARGAKVQKWLDACFTSNQSGMTQAV
jgi:predicted dehydrogenase